MIVIPLMTDRNSTPPNTCGRPIRPCYPCEATEVHTYTLKTSAIGLSSPELSFFPASYHPLNLDGLETYFFSTVCVERSFLLILHFLRNRAIVDSLGKDQKSTSSFLKFLLVSFSYLFVQRLQSTTQRQKEELDMEWNVYKFHKDSVVCKHPRNH